ncbi:MAG: hypothetical protein K2X38_01655 [Gemmataceae bacterium]|nr:hypothetical protein [Gemmataceae bacterium]
MAHTNLSARIICVANIADQVAEPRMVFGTAAIYPPTVLSLPRNPALPWSEGSLDMGDAPTAMASVEVWADREGSVFSASTVRSVHALPHGRSESPKTRMAMPTAAKRPTFAKQGSGKSLVAV